MQIQPINNAPNFQANHLRTAKKIVKSGNRNVTTKIDIYSINKSDNDLIKKLLQKVDIQERSDSKAIKEKGSINDSIRSALNKALNLDEKSNDGVLIAVKNNKRITGILDYTDGGTPMINNLAAWRSDRDGMTRVNLFAQFMRIIAKENLKHNDFEKVDVAALADPATKGHKWLRENGFRAIPPSSSSKERMVVRNDFILSSAKGAEKRLEAATGMVSDKVFKEKQVELSALNL